MCAPERPFVERRTPMTGGGVSERAGAGASGVVGSGGGALSQGALTSAVSLSADSGVTAADSEGVPETAIGDAISGSSDLASASASLVLAVDVSAAVAKGR